MKHEQIPGIVYDYLRAVHESRAKRQDNDATIPHLTNKQIFGMMPDHDAIIWARDAQPAITAETLTNMKATVQWSD